MQLANWLAGCVRPPTLFSETYSVFAGDHAAPGQDLRKKFVQSAFDFFANRCIAIVTVGHDVDMNVAVTGVTKTGDRESRFRAQAFGKLNQIDNATPRHDHVFVQFSETGRAQGVAELPA